jgi:hypothetical protein
VCGFDEKNGGGKSHATVLLNTPNILLSLGQNGPTIWNTLRKRLIIYNIRALP